jgi:hypothetical protein
VLGKVSIMVPSISIWSSLAIKASRFIKKIYGIYSAQYYAAMMYKKRVKHLHKPRSVLMAAKLNLQTPVKAGIPLYKPFFDMPLSNNPGTQNP